MNALAWDHNAYCQRLLLREACGGAGRVCWMWGAARGRWPRGWRGARTGRAGRVAGRAVVVAGLRAPGELGLWEPARRQALAAVVLTPGGGAVLVGVSEGLRTFQM
jgi:hypothetical protein